MDSKKLCGWLRGIMIGLGLAGLFFFGYLIPFMKMRMLTHFNGYWQWVIFALLSAVPCYLVLIEGWKIVNRIEKDNSFCVENAEGLSRVSFYALIDSAYVFIGNVVLMVLGLSRVSVFFLTLLIVIVGVSVGVAAAALSHLVRKAALLKQENDSFI